MLINLLLGACVVALASALIVSKLRQRPEYAPIDDLTGLLSRAALDRRVDELAAQAGRAPQPLAMLVGDIDGLGAINERRGTDVGDAVLAEVAERFRGELRAYDMAYRYDGEQFLVILPGAGEHEAVELAEALRRSVSLDPIRGLAVTASFGVSAWDGRGGFDFGGLLDRSLRALVSAKATGRNRVARALETAPEPLQAA